MRRIKLVFATLIVLVAAFAAFSGPAMAQEELNCRDARGELIRCDGELYAPYNNNDYPPFYNDYYDYNDDYDYPPFYSPFYSDYNYEDFEDYEDYLDELEDGFEDYVNYLEDNPWGYYGW